MIRWLLPLLLSWTSAHAVEPSGWQRKPLAGTPVSVLVPKGSIPQRTDRHPGFDEASTGWQLQSIHWPDRGASRIILYLKSGDITVFYSRENPDPNYKTLDDYIQHETTGRVPDAEDYGKWKGYTVRLIALKDTNRHPPAAVPFGDLAIHAVDFGPHEYLAVTLHAHPDAVEDYLRYFYKVRDSIRYAKPTPVTTAKAPPIMPGSQLPPKKRLVLLPSSLSHNRVGRGFYPYVRVLQCPQKHFARSFELAAPRRLFVQTRIVS